MWDGLRWTSVKDQCGTEYITGPRAEYGTTVDIREERDEIFLCGMNGYEGLGTFSRPHEKFRPFPPPSDMREDPSIGLGHCIAAGCRSLRHSSEVVPSMHVPASRRNKMVESKQKSPHSLRSSNTIG